MGLEHLVLSLGGSTIVGESVIVGPDTGALFGARYRIVCDPGWRARTAQVEVLGAPRMLALVSDGAGHWRDGTGPRPALDGAIDVDISATPFTNTLAIRRLGLREGESIELRAVYVRVPELIVTPDPQRYTRLSRTRYRYESLDTDFTREIEVDDEGLVVDYPGLFTRLS